MEWWNGFPAYIRLPIRRPSRFGRFFNGAPRAATQNATGRVAGAPFGATDATDATDNFRASFPMKQIRLVHGFRGTTAFQIQINKLLHFDRRSFTREVMLKEI
jgi:hypothetical protein